MGRYIGDIGNPDDPNDFLNIGKRREGFDPSEPGYDPSRPYNDPDDWYSPDNSYRPPGGTPSPTPTPTPTPRDLWHKVPGVEMGEDFADDVRDFFKNPFFPHHDSDDLIASPNVPRSRLTAAITTAILASSRRRHSG